MNESVATNNFLANEGRALSYAATDNLVATQVAVGRKSVGFGREGSSPSIPNATIQSFLLDSIDISTSKGKETT